MENEDAPLNEAEKTAETQTITYTSRDIDRTRFDLEPGKETLMLFNGEEFESSL